MANVTREEKITEAIKRMKAMEIYQPIIKSFGKEGLIGMSEPPVGAFYWVEGKELDEIRKWEDEHDALVYLVVRSFTTFGTMDSYLYVSDYPDEWEMDWKDLEQHIQTAYVVNRDAPDCSEFGSIGYRLTIAAGLERVW
jgi:hypothetical protein